MIVRIFQVTTQPGREADFAEFFHNTAIPLMRSQEGLETLIPCAPRPETPGEFAMVMVWRDLAAMKAFVGEDWRDAHILPEEAVLVKARVIKHYELVEA